MPDPIVVVGTGIAGATAALTLRAEGYDGPVVLIGDDPEAPYRRPPLSKEVLTGAQAPARTLLRPAGAWAEKGIERVNAPENLFLGDDQRRDEFQDSAIARRQGDQAFAKRCRD